MTAASFRNSDYFIATVTAVLGHVLFFLLFVGLATVQILSPTQVPAPPPVPEVMVELHPEIFQRPMAPESDLPPPNRYVRTLASQEAAEEAANTNLISEFNTKASGDTVADASAPLRPALEGVTPRSPEEMKTFDSSFQDGLEPKVQPSAVTSAPPGQQVPVEPKPPTPPTEAMAQESVPPTEPLPPPTPAEKLRMTENRVPVPMLDGPGEGRKEEELPKSDPAETHPQASQQPGGEPVEAPKETVAASDEDPGFLGEVRKTRLRGSIGRNGPTSAEVKNTPLGRYQALLSRAVERQWQSSCIRYRDHITPGILTIRFLVDDQGEVSGFRFLDVIEAGEIQKGFTLNAVKTAPIPAMPPVLKKDLEGEPLELIYNFYF